MPRAATPRVTLPLGLQGPSPTWSRGNSAAGPRGSLPGQCGHAGVPVARHAAPRLGAPPRASTGRGAGSLKAVPRTPRAGAPPCPRAPRQRVRASPDRRTLRGGLPAGGPSTCSGARSTCTRSASEPPRLLRALASLAPATWLPACPVRSCAARAACPGCLAVWLPTD